MCDHEPRISKTDRILSVLQSIDRNIAKMGNETIHSRTGHVPIEAYTYHEVEAHLKEINKLLMSWTNDYGKLSAPLVTRLKELGLTTHSVRT